MNAAQLRASDVWAEEHERGRWPPSAAPAQWGTWWECSESAWIIDCAHFPQPRPIAAGRADGSDAGRMFCADCADVLVGAVIARRR